MVTVNIIALYTLKIVEGRFHSIISYHSYKKWLQYLKLLVFSHSVMSNSETPWTAAHQSSLSITNFQSLLNLMSIESMMPSNHLALCHPLLPLPSIFPSIRVFSNESVLRIRWPNYWSFSFSISPFNEYSVLISFRIDWFNCLADQGTLKSLLQHHSSKASVLRCSAFFTVDHNKLWKILKEKGIPDHLTCLLRNLYAG